MSGLLSVATKCGTREDFLRLFQKYIDREDGSLFIVDKETRPLGTKQPFQIKLKDGSIVMRGEAEIVKTFEGKESPTGKRGYCVRLHDLDESSLETYHALLGKPKPKPKPQAVLVDEPITDLHTPTIEMAVPIADLVTPTPDLLTPVPDLMSPVPDGAHRLERVEPRPIVEAPPPSPPVPHDKVIVDLEAGGPERTPIPTAAAPPDGLKRVAVGDASEVLIARNESVDGPPWVRHKRFDPQAVPAEKLVARVREAAAVVHPGLARFLEVAADPDGLPRIVTEWVPGRPLDAVMRRYGELGVPMPPAVAVLVTAQAARATAFAHERRDAHGELAPVFHGCLSPANVICGFDGRVVVSDLIGAIDTIRLGAPIDAREDVLSLAATFRELLGASPPTELVRVMQTAETMGDLATGLERWLSHLEVPFGPTELSQLMMRLFGPRDGSLATGWHVVIGGDPYGPLGFEELLDTMQRLFIGDPVRVWHEGLERWTVILTVPRVMDVVDELIG